ncbi:TRAP transporter TatT component family protein [Anaeromyxobacter paludicola]|uniref:Uncharacterized protein n=1 Tax=Anaeromyxobacter paludicola TaxID=2918171 RepID=A0ABN6NAI4_9BACT|nr:TRAP transporter TatT component family protein [Anaeromyxobacter paludicola]BDG09355.1 hypothetical protein AMPC_24680 [Anaeromyxobacter paludicola]
MAARSRRAALAAAGAAWLVAATPSLALPRGAGEGTDGEAPQPAAAASAATAPAPTPGSTLPAGRGGPGRGGQEPAPDRFAEALARGDRAFAGRADEGLLREAIRAYGDAAAERPGDPRAELPLARAWMLLALAAPAETPGACDAAARAAERALRAQDPAFAAAVDGGEPPEKALAAVKAPGAEALYWLSYASLEAARARGFAAVLAVRDAVLAGLGRAVALDETVDHAGPRRVLGDLLAGLPSAVGGGAAKARAHFERALALAPDYQLTRVREAERLAVLLQDRALFDRLLAEVSGSEPGRAPAVAPENALSRRLAAALRKRADRLF